MIKIILVSKNNEDYAVIKDVVNELDFFYENEFKLERFNGVVNNLKKEIDNLDYKKIYIVRTSLDKKSSSLSLLKYIRKKDYFSEIIIIGASTNNLLGIHNIFEISGDTETGMRERVDAGKDIWDDLHGTIPSGTYSTASRKKAMAVTDRNVKKENEFQNYL